MPDSLLLHDAAPHELEEAAALNHRELFALTAEALGGEVREAEGVTWTYGGSTSDSMVCFPHLSEAAAGPVLDEIIAFYVERLPKSLVGCWSLDPPQTADLGVRLLARGFQPGWQPCWMSLDLHQMVEDHSAPADLRIEAKAGGQKDADVPYADGEGSAWPRILANHPERGHRFLATLGDRTVGNSSVILTKGPFGVAGIYDVGVAEDIRNQGIGKAVTVAACRWARDRGYRYALLNGTGQRMYEQIGFKVIGHGQTWWLNVQRVAAHPPTPNEIALAESVGRGDVDALDRLLPNLTLQDLNKPLTNEMTLLDLTVDCKQPESAEWLVTQGVTLTPLIAWHLGWKDRAAQLLQEDPARVNLRYGDWNTTLLHEAVQMNDVELARLALSAHPDLEIKDTGFNSTPLGWAKHNEAEEIAHLIEAHQAA